MLMQAEVMQPSGWPLGYLLTAGFVATAFVVGFFVVCVFEIRARLRRREWKHIERMKSLDLGQPLPDADLSRAWAVGLIGILVSLALVGAAAYVSFLATEKFKDGRVMEVWFTGQHGPPLLLIPWLGCGLLILITVILSLRTLRRLGEPSLQSRKARASKQVPADLPSAVPAEQS
jgi:amino acid transporter